MNEVFVKTMDGTGAAIDVNCGFVPAYVKVVNIEQATVSQLEWYRGMADASALRTSGTLGTGTKIVANGITPKGDAASDTVEQGFTIGADTVVNIATETLVIFAYRGGEGNQF